MATNPSSIRSSLQSSLQASLSSSLNRGGDNGLPSHGQGGSTHRPSNIIVSGISTLNPNTRTPQPTPTGMQPPASLVSGGLSSLGGLPGSCSVDTDKSAAPQKRKRSDTDARDALPIPRTTKACGFTGPRPNPLSWDDYFMSISFLSSYRSKDPSTQVGACIVNSSNRIIGIGYNGFPAGCSDAELPWDRTGPTSLDTKYPYVCHAEVNAVLNTAASCSDARIYVALFPCNECAKIIIQSGIKEVVYLSDKYHDTEACVASRRMFQMAGVKTRQHVPKEQRIVIDFGGEGRDGLKHEQGEESVEKKGKIERIAEEEEEVDK